MLVICDNSWGDVSALVRWYTRHMHSFNRILVRWYASHSWYANDSVIIRTDSTVVLVNTISTVVLMTKQKTKKKSFLKQAAYVVKKAWSRDVFLFRSLRRSSYKNSMDFPPKWYWLLNSSSRKFDREKSSGILNVLLFPLWGQHEA